MAGKRRHNASAIDMLREAHKRRGSPKPARGSSWNAGLRVVPDASRLSRGRRIFDRLRVREQRDVLALFASHHVKSASAALVEIDRWRHWHALPTFYDAAQVVLARRASELSGGDS
jgi:hypothetical protein